ncbi:MAG: hypothetical protein WCV84_00500 [Patescibacteria group bacterium]
MVEAFSNREGQAAETTDALVKTTNLEKGSSSGWENEQRFTAEEALKAIKDLVPEAGELKLVEQVLEDGMLVRAYFRAPGSDCAYTFCMKGKFTRFIASEETRLDKVFYMDADSEDVCGGDDLFAYRNGAWVKRG